MGTFKRMMGVSVASEHSRSLLGFVKTLTFHAKQHVNHLQIKRTRIYNNLLQYSDVIEPFREPGIVGAYRPSYMSITDYIISAMCWTNETMNIWTHLLASILFAYYAFFIVADRYGIFWSDISNYGPLIFMAVTGIVYPLMSCLAHTFCSYSLTVYRCAFFLDYFGLSLYSFGTAVGYISYALPMYLKDTLYENVYLEVAALLSFSITFTTILSRYSQSHTLQKIGVILPIGISYVWVSSMLLIRIPHCLVPRNESYVPKLNECDPYVLSIYAIQFFTLIVTAITYGLHIPEKYFPGQFDIFGHSHQIMHVTGITTTFLCFTAAAMDSVKVVEEFGSLECQTNINRTILTIFFTGFGNSALVAYFLFMKLR